MIPADVRRQIEALREEQRPLLRTGEPTLTLAAAAALHAYEKVVRILDAHDAGADEGIPVGLQGLAPRLTVDSDPGLRRERLRPLMHAAARSAPVPEAGSLRAWSAGEARGGQMATKAEATSERAVLVTTEHRGVFFGYLIGEAAKASVRLRACRNVVYWDTEARGFVGLAADGPTNGCRVTKPAGDESTLFDITSVIACTEAAAKRFEAAPWSR